jgi:hypothetical protein
MTEIDISLQEICKPKKRIKITFKPFISKTLDNELCKECRPLKLTCMFVLINCGSVLCFLFATCRQILRSYLNVHFVVGGYEV